MLAAMGVRTLQSADDSCGSSQGHERKEGALQPSLALLLHSRWPLHCTMFQRVLAQKC